jgi:hypothetical protein
LHRPYDTKVKIVSNNINVKSTNSIVVLHYGLSSHDLLARKLEYHINTAKVIGHRAHGVPQVIPHPKNWAKLNGYKACDERSLILKKVEQCWYKNVVPDVPKPTFESLYNVVAKYNIKMAEEYAKIYGR